MVANSNTGEVSSVGGVLKMLHKLEYGECKQGGSVVSNCNQRERVARETKASGENIPGRCVRFCLPGVTRREDPSEKVLCFLLWYVVCPMLWNNTGNKAGCEVVSTHLLSPLTTANKFSLPAVDSSHGGSGENGRSKSRHEPSALKESRQRLLRQE